MPLKVRCPSCSKSVRLDGLEAGRPDFGALSRVAICPACGQRIEVPAEALRDPGALASPPPLLAPLSSLTEEAPADSTENANTADGPFVPSIHFAVEIPLPLADEVGKKPRSGVENVHAVPIAQPHGVEGVRESRTLRFHPLWWIAASFAFAALALSGIYAAGGFDSWEQSHFRQITEMKARAESLAADGKLKEAHQKYADLRQLTDGRDIRDPALVALIEQALADQRRIYSLLLGRNEQSGKGAADPASIAPAPPPRPSSSIDSPYIAPPPADPTGSPTVPTTPQPATNGGAPRRSSLNSLPELNDSKTQVATEIKADTAERANLAPATRPAMNRPAPQPVVPDRNGLTDEKIGKAIQRGVNYLLGEFDPNNHIIPDPDSNDAAMISGRTALAVYALLQSGQAINDPRLNVRGPTMSTLMNTLKLLNIKGSPETYARALRATCLALFNRPEDFPTLADDADYLLGTTINGAYTYSATRIAARKRSFGPNGRGWDNSNSQYGLLGVWSATEAEPRIEVPSAYWRAVQKHWNDCQLPTGQWDYTAYGRGSSTMTCAGIASLMVAHEYLEPPMGNDAVGREPFTPELRKALDWFEQGDNSTRVVEYWWGYSLYGIERVGLASGFKQFGKHDWYRELATKIVESQDARGSWRDPINTSYALLFLSRGRHPILMNKLRFDRRGIEVAGPAAAKKTPQPKQAAGAFWNNRPRDLSNLSRFAGRQLERPVNWQIVSIDNAWTDWTDSPIVYIASHLPPKLTDEDVDKLRAFVEAGGLLFTHADASTGPFNGWVKELAHKLFPKYEMSELPADHPIYNIVYKPTPRPTLWSVSNGARVLMIHSPTDLSLAWQNRLDRAWEGIGAARRAAQQPELRNSQLAPFQLGVNLFVYAAGKRDLRNRIDTAWVANVESEPIAKLPVARLRYAGNYDPEPGAWRRYANWFHQQTGYAIDLKTVKLSELKDSDGPLAHLTGTARQLFTDAEVDAVRNYVEGGGVLLVDMAGGFGQFDQSIVTLLSAAFPGNAPHVIDRAHPILSDGNPGMEAIPRPRLRPFTIDRLGTQVGEPGMISAGKGHVVITNLDITCALLGTNTWGILGYEPSYAQSLVKNTLLWTIDQQSLPRPAAK